MAGSRFTGSFTQQETISGQRVAAALAMRHRYNRAPNEMSALDRHFADWQGVDNSHALQIVLRSAGAGSAKLFDMRLPHAFTMRHCDTIAEFLLAETDRPALARAP